MEKYFNTNCHIISKWVDEYNNLRLTQKLTTNRWITQFHPWGFCIRGNFTTTFLSCIYIDKVKIYIVVLARSWRTVLQSTINIHIDLSTNYKVCEINIIFLF